MPGKETARRRAKGLDERQKEEVTLTEETPEPGTSRGASTPPAPRRGVLSYRRRSYCLLWLWSLCCNLGISGWAPLRGAGWAGGLRDLHAHRWWVLGETMTVSGMGASRGAQTVQTCVTAGCWDGGIKPHNLSHLLPALHTIFEGRKWLGRIRVLRLFFDLWPAEGRGGPGGWRMPCRARNTTGTTPRSA